MSEDNDIRKQIEALLFASGRALAVEDLASITDLDKRKVKKALNALKEDYNSRDTSLMIMEEGNSWKLNIREQFVSLVTKIIADTELSKTVLETLGVIAWKAPVLQSYVIKVRGSQAYEHVKDLVLMGFVNKDKDGRSYILKLSEKFFEYFDVPGDKGIKEALKEAKQPLPVSVPDHVGDLEVYSREEQEKRDQELKLQHQQEKVELMARLEEQKKDIKVDRDFLDSVGGKIDAFSKKNDELDDDDLFKRTTLEDKGESDSETVSKQEGDNFTDNLESEVDLSEKEEEQEEQEESEENSSKEPELEKLEETEETVVDNSLKSDILEDETEKTENKEEDSDEDDFLTEKMTNPEEEEEENKDDSLSSMS